MRTPLVPLFIAILPLCGWTQTAKLLPADTAAGDRLGFRVACDGRLAVVGAPRDQDNGSDSGSAYVYDLNSSAAPLKLLPTNGAIDDFFGWYCAVEGSHIVVTAPGQIGGGKFYRFDAATGAQTGEFWPADGTDGNGFGYSVVIDGSRALIGAPYSYVGPTVSGSAYLYDLNTGLLLRKFTPSDGAPGDSFGWSVALEDGIAVIGARLASDVGYRSGAVYVFDANTGAQIRKLRPVNGGAGDWLGNSVAMQGNTAIVGAPWNDDAASDAGTAYLFNINTGVQTGQLFASDASSSDLFGFTVDISGTRAIVGALDNVNSLGGDGSAYVFDAHSGAQLSKLFPQDAHAGQEFCGSLALHGEHAIIGASRDNEHGTIAGAAYHFNIQNSPGNVGNAYCFGDGSGAACPCGVNGNAGEGCANTGGSGALLAGLGNATLSQDSFRIRVSGVPNGRPAILMRGDSQVSLPMGHGILCLSGNLLYTPVRVTQGGGAVFTDFGGAAFGSIANLGSETNFQFWYRDVDATCAGQNTNYSNAWSVVYQP